MIIRQKNQEVISDNMILVYQAEIEMLRLTLKQQREYIKYLEAHQKVEKAKIK
jgi:hypothetical protein